MESIEMHLVIKKSTLPNAGMGLFSTKEIKKGIIITEYTGRVSAWKDVDHCNYTNQYIFYISRYKVIDALNHKNVLARYINDARGIKKIPGIMNNSEYFIEKGRVFVKSKKRIPAGSEILISYGKEYWEYVKQNENIDKLN